MSTPLLLGIILSALLAVLYNHVPESMVLVAFGILLYMLRRSLFASWISLQPFFLFLKIFLVRLVQKPIARTTQGLSREGDNRQIFAVHDMELIQKLILCRWLCTARISFVLDVPGFFLKLRLFMVRFDVFAGQILNDLQRFKVPRFFLKRRCCGGFVNILSEMMPLCRFGARSKLLCGVGGDLYVI